MIALASLLSNRETPRFYRYLSLTITNRRVFVIHPRVYSLRFYLVDNNNNTITKTVEPRHNQNKSHRLRIYTGFFFGYDNKIEKKPL